MADPLLALDVDLAIATRARAKRAEDLRAVLKDGDFFAAVLFLLGD